MEEAGQGVGAEEAEGGAADDGGRPGVAGERLGEGDTVSDDGALDLVPHPHDAALPVSDLTHPIRRPSLPGPRGRIPRLEHEASAGAEGVAHAAQRLAQLLVADEHLERVPGHHDQLELRSPPPRPQITEHPLDAAAVPPGLYQHGGGRIEPHEPPRVTVGPGPPEQPARTAPDIEHRVGGPHKTEVEVVARPPRIEGVVQHGEREIRERPIDHRGSVSQLPYTGRDFGRLNAGPALAARSVEGVVALRDEGAGSRR
ncbi:hypothetical protein AQI70_16800 [Streptomyces curacoi]|uniref:Uncharacterized protein n=1 Tax=Streptomyces curacoi TaxID=146536 RepID=A0A124H0W2_9ACTN|nr:hypothetical protein AQI70_16800 [Streptomyces curacoi]